MRRNTSATTLAVLTALLVAGAAERGSAGLVALWHFDETPGSGVAADSVGSADGILAGDAAFVPGGISGNAVQVTRVGGGIVDMGDNFGFVGSDFSVVGWIRTLTPGDATPESIFVAKHVSTIVSGYFLAINSTAAMGGPGRALFFHNNMPAFTPISTSSNLNDGAWHQIVGTYEAGGNARIYVDGVLEDTKTSAALVGNVGHFLIGGVDQPSGGDPPVTTFEGRIDEVSLYDHVLSAAEVSDLYGELVAPSLLVDLSTGWDDGLSGLIPAPGSDDDWTLHAAPGGVGLGAAAVTIPSALWFDPTSDGAAWIAPPAQTDSNGQSSPAGQYTFRYEFERPPALQGKVFRISGVYQSDDSIVEVRLNGNVLAAGVGGSLGAGFEGPFESRDPSHFVTGTNVLEVVVENAVGPGPNPVGLVVSGAVRYGPGGHPVPLLPGPAAPLLPFALAAGGLVSLRRRMRSAEPGRPGTRPLTSSIFP